MNLELIFLKKLQEILSNKDLINDAVVARESLKIKDTDTYVETSLSCLENNSAFQENGQLLKELPREPQKTVWVDEKRINGAAEFYGFNQTLSQYQKIILDAAVMQAHFHMHNMGQDKSVAIEDKLNKLPRKPKERTEEQRREYEHLSSQQVEIINNLQQISTIIMKKLGKHVTFTGDLQSELTNEAKKALNDEITRRESTTAEKETNAKLSNDSTSLLAPDKSQVFSKVDSMIDENESEAALNIKSLFLNKLKEILSNKDLINEAVEDRKILRKVSDESVCKLDELESKKVFNSEGNWDDKKVKEFGLNNDFDLKERLHAACKEYQFNKDFSLREKIILAAAFYSAADHVNQQLLDNGSLMSHELMQKRLMIQKELNSIRPKIGPLLALNSPMSYALSKQSLEHLDKSISRLNQNVKAKPQKHKEYQAEEIKKKTLHRGSRAGKWLLNAGRLIIGGSTGLLAAGAAGALIKSSLVGISIMPITLVASLVSPIALGVLGGLALAGLAMGITGKVLAAQSNKSKTAKQEKPKTSNVKVKKRVRFNPKVEQIGLSHSSLPKNDRNRSDVTFFGHGKGLDSTQKAKEFSHSGCKQQENQPVDRQVSSHAFKANS